MKQQNLQISFLVTCIFVAKIAAVEVESENIHAEVELQIVTALKTRLALDLGEVTKAAQEWGFAGYSSTITAVGVAVSQQQPTGVDASGERQFNIVVCAAIPADIKTKFSNGLKNSVIMKAFRCHVVRPREKEPVADGRRFVTSKQNAARATPLFSNHDNSNRAGIPSTNTDPNVENDP